MLTELGIDEIAPQAERSVVRWAPERVERGLTGDRPEATKQCRRFRVPTVRCR